MLGGVVQVGGVGVGAGGEELHVRHPLLGFAQPPVDGADLAAGVGAEVIRRPLGDDLLEGLHGFLGVAGLRLADADGILCAAGVNRVGEVVNDVAKLADGGVDLAEPTGAFREHELRVRGDLGLRVELEEQLVFGARGFPVALLGVTLGARELVAFLLGEAGPTLGGEPGVNRRGRQQATEQQGEKKANFHALG